MSNNTPLRRVWNRVLNTAEWKAEVKEREELRKKHLQEEERLKKIAELKETVKTSSDKIIYLNSASRKLKNKLSPLLEERNELLKRASASPAGRTKAAETKYATISSLARQYEENIARLEDSSIFFEILKLRADHLVIILETIPPENLDGVISEAEGLELDLIRISDCLRQVEMEMDSVNEEDMKAFRAHCDAADAADAGINVDSHICCDIVSGGD